MKAESLPLKVLWRCPHINRKALWALLLLDDAHDAGSEQGPCSCPVSMLLWCSAARQRREPRLCVVAQEKKRLVFEGTVGGSAESLAKLTEDDMKFLFS